MIPVYSNSLGEEELEAIARVFRSKWLGMGEECRNLEAELGAHWKTDKVLLLNCATAGLHISLKALGVQAGDEVIISTVNFLGCANAVLDIGAKPIFADVDRRTLNILPEEIERLKTPRTKAVYILHYGGHPADFDAIQAVCGPDIAIIEDSANAVASLYKGRYCGTLGAAGVFSFDAMKTLVMGDGGALLIRDPEIFQKAKALRYLGFHDKNVSGTDSLKNGSGRWWEFDIDCASGRFISNDIAAAMGRVQLTKLPAFLARRKSVWEFYQANLAGIPGLIIPPEPLPDTTSSYYIYWIHAPGRRDALAAHLAENGIYSTFRYFPLHQVPFYRAGVRLPNAEEAAENVLNLPLHQNLSDADIEKIVSCVKSFFGTGPRLG